MRSRNNLSSLLGAVKDTQIVLQSQKRKYSCSKRVFSGVYSRIAVMGGVLTQKDNPLDHEGMPCRDGKTLQELYENYGVRQHTIAKMSDMALITVNTLVFMTEQKLDEVIQSMVENFHIELLLGERYGLKVAVRTEEKAIEKGGL